MFVALTDWLGLGRLCERLFKGYSVILKAISKTFIIF